MQLVLFSQWEDRPAASGGQLPNRPSQGDTHWAQPASRPHTGSLWGLPSRPGARDQCRRLPLPRRPTPSPHVCTPPKIHTYSLPRMAELGLDEVTRGPPGASVPLRVGKSLLPGPAPVHARASEEWPSAPRHGASPELQPRTVRNELQLLADCSYRRLSVASSPE